MYEATHVKAMAYQLAVKNLRGDNSTNPGESVLRINLPFVVENEFTDSCGYKGMWFLLDGQKSAPCIFVHLELMGLRCNCIDVQPQSVFEDQLDPMPDPGSESGQGLQGLPSFGVAQGFAALRFDQSGSGNNHNNLSHKTQEQQQQQPQEARSQGGGQYARP
jgi:hypothetical protein